MYSLIKYLTGSKTKNEEQNEITPPTPPTPDQKPRAEVKNCSRKARSSKSTVYLVIEKETQNPLGIFDTVELAKQYGQKITHYNCMIISFNINDPCKYLFTPVFEDR